MITLDNLAVALRASWGADTAYDATDWSAHNPARGQCVVSSLVVQDYMGGELVRYSVSGHGFEETQYVNKLDNGVQVDTTASQYQEPVTLQMKLMTFEKYASAREKMLADGDTARRYALLSERVRSNLHQS